MIEILTIIISLLGGYNVSDGQRTATMLPFGGEAHSAYFTGSVMQGGCDTQLREGDSATLSARYMLHGRDCDSTECDIFIENNGRFGEQFTHPRIITNSKALGFLNTDSLLGRLDFSDGKLTIRLYRVLPKVEQCGTVETFDYTAADGLRKHARVYLPGGYTKDRKYNVLYLIHGGGDNSTSFFADPRSPLPLTQVLDVLIAEGKMEPVIVVTPTFYPDDENIGANRMQDAVQLTRDFHHELLHHLVPAVETHYSTHLSGTDSVAVVRSREHRAFGGFSMGALCTWYQLAYGSDAVSRFLPLSGDLWVYDDKGEKQNADVAAEWLLKQLAAQQSDYRVMAYSGTDDIAGKPETAFVEALRKASTDFPVTFYLHNGGRHYYGHINEYLYHALPRLW